MSYDELKAHAQRIKELCIHQTVEITSDAEGGSSTADALEWAETAFADTDKIFDDWLDLPDFSGSLGNIEAALPYLATETYLSGDATDLATGSNLNLTQIEPTGAFAQGWQSGTATNYANFAGLFGPVISNEWLCAHVLRHAIKAEQEIFDQARRDVDSIAHAAIDTLENITDKGASGFTATIAVLAAVSGIVAVPFTAGGSLAAAYSFAAISGGLGLSGLFSPKESEKHPKIDGQLPSTVVSSVQTYLTELNGDIVKGENDVATALQRSLSQVRSAIAASPSPFVLPRPTVADSPGGFGNHESGN